MAFNCLNCFNFRYAHGCLTNFEWHNLVLFILFYSIYLQSYNFISFPSLFLFLFSWGNGLLAIWKEESCTDVGWEESCAHKRKYSSI